MRKFVIITNQTNLKYLFLLSAFISIQTAICQVDTTLTGRQIRKLVWKNNNLIKYDPLQIIVGEIPVSWECRLGKKISLEATAGVTISGSINRFWLEEVTVYEPEATLGYVAGISGRFYLNKNPLPMRGFYLSPGARYRYFRDSEFDNTSEIICNLSVGYQHRAAKWLVLDYYAGIGFERVKSRSHMYDWWWYYNPPIKNYNQLTAVAGVKMAIHKSSKPSRPAKEEKWPDLESRRLVFKFAPQRIALADYELGVECRFSKKWSVELEGGFTKSHTAFERFYIEVPVPHFTAQGGFESTTALGYAGSLSFRYYLTKKAATLAGWYLSPIIKYRKYNDDYYFENYDYSTNTDHSRTSKGYLQETFVSVTAGNQIWLLKTLSLDVYAGLGFGAVKGVYKIVGEKVPGWQGFYPYYEFYGVKYNKSSLVPTAGLKLCFGF